MGIKVLHFIYRVGFGLYLFFAAIPLKCQPILLDRRAEDTLINLLRTLPPGQQTRANVLIIFSAVNSIKDPAQAKDTGRRVMNCQKNMPLGMAFRRKSWVRYFSHSLRQNLPEPEPGWGSASVMRLSTLMVVISRWKA
jgi:hypothetical protein